MKSKSMLTCLAALSQFLWVVVVSMVAHVVAYAKDDATKKYPPYPDVWEWVAPHPERIDTTSFRTLPLDNGDVLIVYTEAVPIGEPSQARHARAGGADEKIGSITAKVSGKGKKPKTRDVQHLVTLFGGQRLTDTTSIVRVLRGQDTALKLDDGSTVRVLPETKSTGWDYPRLSEGEEVSYAVSYPTYGSNISYAHDCYNGPGRHSLVIRGKDINGARTPSIAVTIFKILDQPQTIRLTQCPYEENQSFTTRVTNPRAGFMFALADGSFFAEIDTGVLMRFDARLDSKSRLAFNTYFPLSGWDVDHGQGYLKKLTGRDYAYPGTYDRYNFQRMTDDLYHHLLDLKQRASK